MRVIGHRGRARAARALAALVLSVGLVAVAAPPAETAASGAVVTIVLDEWKLVLSQVTTPSGRVTFVVRNDGTMAHEFVVVRSDRHHHLLKVKGGKAVETGRLGKIPTIPSGTTRRLTLRVLPGKYVLLCNMLGHYQAGQRAALRAR